MSKLVYVLPSSPALPSLRAEQRVDVSKVAKVVGLYMYTGTFLSKGEREKKEGGRVVVSAIE